jgi:CubicO group peptidase (beta-lactamase class C family)
MKTLRMLGFLLAAALPPLAGATPSDSAVVDFIQSEISERQITGLQMVVIQHGKQVLSKTFGVASIQYGLPVRDDTVFSINSATKSFTGVAVMQLLEQGKIDLQAPASRYLDGLPASVAIHHDQSVAHSHLRAA